MKKYDKQYHELHCVKLAAAGGQATHNTNVENFEKLIRGTYKVNGSAIGGSVIKHLKK